MDKTYILNDLMWEQDRSSEDTRVYRLYNGFTVFTKYDILFEMTMFSTGVMGCKCFLDRLTVMLGA